MKRILDFNSFVNEAIVNEAQNWGDYESLKSKIGLSDAEISAAVENLAAGKSKSQLTKNDIMVLQASVDTEGKFTKPDGSYGIGTVNAVKNWQTSGLGFTGAEADGVWGPKTAKATFDGSGKLTLKWLTDKFKMDAAIGGIKSAASQIISKAKMDSIAMAILAAMSGMTEDEDAVYKAFKDNIKTKEDYDKLSEIWNSMKISKRNLDAAELFWKNKSVDDVIKMNANNTDGITLGEMFNEYFNDTEINRLNSYLPAGVEKF